LVKYELLYGLRCHLREKRSMSESNELFKTT